MAAGANGTGRPGALTTHLLRITLLDVRPPVWRLLRVPSTADLATLHLLIQTAMGWEDRHLHEWEIAGRTYGTAGEENWGEDVLQETGAVLADLAGPDVAFRYEYDLGDGWEHLVEVVAVEPYDATAPPVQLLDGARAAPPEDCGGPGGYEHLLDALRDPADPEHEELAEVFGDWFDPDAFDRIGVERQLERFWRV